MTTTVKRLAASLMAFVIPFAGTAAVNADDVIAITGVELKADSEFYIPAAGDPVTYPDNVSAKSTIPAGYEKDLDIRYCWQDIAGNLEYSQDRNDTGTFTAGDWYLNIIIGVPSGYTISDPFESSFSLGGSDFTYYSGGTDYIRYRTKMAVFGEPAPEKTPDQNPENPETSPSKTSITNLVITDNGSLTDPASGDPVTYPTGLSVSSTEPLGYSWFLRLSSIWTDLQNNKVYSQNAGDSGSFTSGKWALDIIISIDDEKTSDYQFENLPQSLTIGNRTFKLFINDDSSARYRTEINIGSDTSNTSDKKSNTLSVRGKSLTFKFRNLKKKDRKLSAARVISFRNRGQGKLRYAKVSGNGNIKINRKNGRITVRKKLKKGTYKIKVRVRAYGNSEYNVSAWKTVTIKIKVK